MKKIIVTGCNGQLGRAINKIYHNSTEYECVNTDVGELDITNIDAVKQLVSEVRPYAIINCAAHTNVNGCENDIDNAYKINAIGPRNLSIAASDCNAKLMHISTDYVFDGHADTPYTEFDTPNPKAVYGKTKLAGENFVREFAKDYFIIRTAWLYGDGKNFVKTMLGLSENHDKVTVVGDQFGSPTSADELAKAIAYLLPTDNFGLFHGTCEGITNWADFTREIYRLAGKSTVVETVTTEQYDKNTTGIVAPRPAYSVLENYMLKLTTNHMFADWEKAIAEYIKEL
ncbi:MAG: dTDP-4-dehydrorhamnose reductase [Lachnospiraceae bacterium]|nr:dTDP-4-dehydrorhamnose reductase [Lachnospiraceae bacterium]